MNLIYLIRCLSEIDKINNVYTYDEQFSIELYVRIITL